MERLHKIRQIQHAITAAEHKFTEQYGLCFNEAMLLYVLQQENRPITPNEISDILGLSHSNTSKVLSSAENKDYVLRTLGKEDKRHMYFTLTETGEKMLGSIDSDTIDLPQI